jgi:hypothetical protein
MPTCPMRCSDDVIASRLRCRADDIRPYRDCGDASTRGVETSEANELSAGVAHQPKHSKKARAVHTSVA